MAEWLVVRLGDLTQAQWMVCNDAGEVIVKPVAGELAQAAAMSANRKVAVIVGAGEALVTESDAPGRNAAKLAQVIPFALEERVADEVENLHFAIGARSRETGRVPVVVVQRARLTAWLDALRAAGLVPQALYVESTLLPATPGQIIALLDRDTLTLRLPEGPPLVFPALAIADSFEMVLATQQASIAGLEPAAPGLLLYTGHDEWQAHQHSFDALREQFTGVKVQMLPSGPITALAAAAVSGEEVNLLQGAFEASSPLASGWRAWRVAASLAGVLLCLHLGARVYELTRLGRMEAQLDASIEEAFRAAMPGEQNASDARRRVERRLAEARSGGGGALLPALAALANARGGAQNVSIEGFSFRDGTLDLRMVAPDAASLDAVGQQLRTVGWQTDFLGGAANGDGYRGRLQMKRAGV